MRTPVDGDRAAGYLVKSSGPMGSVRVSILESDEEVWTVYEMAHRLEKANIESNSPTKTCSADSRDEDLLCFPAQFTRVALVLHQIDPHLVPELPNQFTHGQWCQIRR